MIDELLLDLDGVFVDFYAYGKDVLGIDYKALPPAQAWGALEKIPHLFRDIPPLVDGKRLWRALQLSHAKKSVLSALPKPTGYLVTADPDKRIWVARELSATMPVFTVEGGINKAQYARPNRLLIDDLARNVEAFVAAGGAGIVHTDAESTIRQLIALNLLPDHASQII